ncbi:MULTISPECIES: thermonuclease family protein [unclassified Roseovarius]|uniref:thermonuclease family protein n=1 Tax=unclassified Roseovarius TaxID=2614913 RepID=UPI00273D118F|nr:MULTISPECIES: thermonuclease family protein [unclassified Roseovarius]
MLRICSVLVLLALAPPVLAGFQGTVRVIDGDTLDVGGVRVRLHGIDAPEVGQTCQTAEGKDWDCGTWVSREVRAQFQGVVASCDPVEKDRYGRIVATCRVDGRDMGRGLVQRGMAVAYRKYSRAYVADERAAKRANAGLHAGAFQRPSQHRKSNIKQAPVPDQACIIKGNISGKGTRIFHVPGQQYYDATRIRADKGERWFCSEAEARAAGWRKAWK